MDFNVKKLVGDAGQFLGRALQKTEEVLYKTESTNLDPVLEGRLKEMDNTKALTTRLVKDTEAVLQPNPGNRVEDFLMEKIEKKRPARMTNLEYLGSGMIESGNEFGPTSAYGSMLIKVGQTEMKLGETERAFVELSMNNFIEPLNRFLENEVKNAMQEKKTLENRRLDLDAAKNRLRKARSTNTAPKDGSNPRVLIQQAEQEVIQCQTEFTQQSELVRTQLDVLNVARDRLVENLKSLAAAQTTFYTRCHQQMLELNREIGNLPLHSINLNSSFSLDSQTQEDEGLGSGSGSGGDPLRGKVMYDYTARGPEELSCISNEILVLEECSDNEFFFAQRGNSRGRVPKSVILVL